MGVIVETQIHLHTAWQALTGQLPPLALPPLPVRRAVLDSRDVAPGDLFIALMGQKTDAHNYLADVFAQGALVVICEERGRETAVRSGAAVVDCTTGRWELRAKLPKEYTPAVPLAFIVDNAVDGLQRVGGFQRAHNSRTDLRVIGITGSVGKTSTKELAAAVLQQRYRILYSKGNLNSEEGLPLTLLSLGMEHERAVLEMGMTAQGEIHRLCELARPLVGVITNVGPSHLSRLGSMEAIQQAKSELVRALPAADDGGVAVLNWDDARVRAMAEWTPARVFRYGLTPEADLWADEITSTGLDGIRFRFHHRQPGGAVDSLHVRVPLLGRHSVHNALRAAAVGLLEGLGWDEIVAGLQDIPGQLRLVVIPGINGSTLVDDTYNASPASTVAALNLLADLTPEAGGRRVAVLGDMLELGNFTTEGHKLVGRRAADVADLLITVGDLGRSIGEEALYVGFDGARLHCMPDAPATIHLLRQELRPNDLVLVKGSRAIGMESIVSEISSDTGRAH